GIGQLLLYYWKTGTIAANGIQSKSFLYDRPIFYLGDFIDRTAANIKGLIGTFSGLQSWDYVIPGSAFFIAIAIFVLITRVPMWRPFAIGIIVGLATVFVTVSTLVSAQWHNLRYIQPFIPILIFLSVTGINGLFSLESDRHSERNLAHAVLTMALVFSLSVLP